MADTPSATPPTVVELSPEEVDLIRQVRKAAMGGAQTAYVDPAGGVSPLAGAELLRSIANTPPRGLYSYFAFGAMARAELLRLADVVEATTAEVRFVERASMVFERTIAATLPSQSPVHPHLEVLK